MIRLFDKDFRKSMLANDTTLIVVPADWELVTFLCTNINE